MSKRAARNVKRGLKERQEDFDRIPLQNRTSMTRPGSLNPRKSGSGGRGKRR